MQYRVSVGTLIADYRCVQFPPPGFERPHLSPCPRQTPYLFCKTHRAQVWATYTVGLWEDIEKKSVWYDTDLATAKNIRILEIRTEHGGPAVGELYLHNTNQLVPFLLAAGDSIKAGPGQSVDLVAIHRSVVHEKYDDGPPVVSERYRALWVDWENGIGYRLGVGWVERASWETVDRTEVDLVLG